MDDLNCEDLINFVNRHFAAEMPRFEGEEFQNIYTVDGAPAWMPPCPCCQATPHLCHQVTPSHHHQATTHPDLQHLLRRKLTRTMIVSFHLHIN